MTKHAPNIMAVVLVSDCADPSQKNISAIRTYSAYVKSDMALFNLLDQLAFYGSYHANKWNQLIHFIFVPTILWTLLVWLAYFGPITSTVNTSAISQFIQLPVVLNVPLLLVAAYTLFYLKLDAFAGASWGLFVGTPLWLTATAFQSQVHNANLLAVPIHVFSWYMQIHPGHAVLEKRKPALMDSLVQAFALAPLFVWFELLFLLGYKPGLYKQLKNRVGVNIAAHRRQQSAKAI